MKKIEIIVEECVLDKVIDILNDNDLLSQTELREQNTKEKHATKTGLFSSTTSIRLSILCSNKEKDKIVARLFPIINMFGGFCATHDLFY